MLKATILASALSLAVAVPAFAGDIQRAQPPRPSLPDDVVQVQQPHSNPVGTIVGDAIGGAIVGGAVGGGVALYNRYVSSNGNWGNWQRDILVGGGIGLGVGLILGGINAASNADHIYAPGLEERGFSPPATQYGVHF